MSGKIYFFQISIFIMLGMNIAVAEVAPQSTSSDDVKGNCTCGGFSTVSPTPENEPLLSQAPGLLVKCNGEGETACRSLCVALANVTKAKGPEILCNRLKDANELKLSAFFKVCQNPWIYADMTAEEPLCCDNAKVKICPSAQKDNSTIVVDAKTVM